MSDIYERFHDSNYWTIVLNLSLHNLNMCARAGMVLYWPKNKCDFYVSNLKTYQIKIIFINKNKNRWRTYITLIKKFVYFYEIKFRNPENKFIDSILSCYFVFKNLLS